MEELKQIAERLRGLRDSLDMSLDEMANDCGLDAATLTLYESGEHDIPVSFIQKLSNHYGVEFTALLFGEEPKMKSYYVTRRGKGVKVERREAYSYQDLAAGFRARDMVPFLVTISPDYKRDDPHTQISHEGQEFNYVLEGTLELKLGEKLITLSPGDSIMFSSTVPHSLRAVGDKEARILTVIN